MRRHDETEKPDDMTLMAYADGELGPAAIAEVEAWVGRAPELKTRVEEFMRSRALLQAALAAPLHEPAPQQSSALISALGLTVEREQMNTVVPLRRRASLSPVIAYALAAGLAALTFGFGGGLAWQTSVEYAARIAALEVANEAAMRQAVALTLETSPNGRAVLVNGGTGARHTITPLATFVTDRGEICREYLFAGTYDEIATACRDDDGRWRPRAVAGRRS